MNINFELFILKTIQRYYRDFGHLDLDCVILTDNNLNTLDSSHLIYGTSQKFALESTNSTMMIFFSLLGLGRSPHNGVKAYLNFLYPYYVIELYYIYFRLKELSQNISWNRKIWISNKNSKIVWPHCVPPVSTACSQK